MLKNTKKLDTEQKILDYVKENYEVSAKNIIEFLGISPQATYKHLNKLVESGKLEKLGRPPRVFYKLGDTGKMLTDKTNLVLALLLHEKIKQNPNQDVNIKYNFENEFLKLQDNLRQKLTESKYLENIHDELAGLINSNSEEIISKSWYTDFLWVFALLEKRFIYITPEGEIYDGFIAFHFWCHKRKSPLSKTFLTYWETIGKYAQFKTPDNNFVVATNKFQDTFKKDTQVNEVYYCDFYSIEIFGKTKLGSLLLHGKQSQNQKIIKQVCYEVKDRIVDFIQKNQIDAVAFIPPTTPRKPQFMDEFRKILDLKLPIIKLEKIINDIAIQQKTLKSGEDRIENAKNTIFVDDQRNFKKVLLLDDAVGSGSTFNEIARKIRRQNLQKDGKIYAVAIVGSANGIVDNNKKFEVINEV